MRVVIASAFALSMCSSDPTASFVGNWKYTSGRHFETCPMGSSGDEPITHAFTITLVDGKLSRNDDSCIMTYQVSSAGAALSPTGQSCPSIIGTRTFSASTMTLGSDGKTMTVDEAWNTSTGTQTCSDTVMGALATKQ
jgi:hypothetical protein